MGGFFQRLDRGTYPAHILEHVTIELQSLCGSDVGFGRARAIDEDAGLYRVIVEYEARRAGAGLPASRPRNPAGGSERHGLRRAGQAGRAARRWPTTCAWARARGSIVEAAQTRGIPVRRINGQNLVQLGYGSRQRKIWTAETDRTSAIAEAIAKDKQLTRQMLQAVGVPTPERPHGHQCRRRLGSGAGDRPARRRQAAGRQLRPRRGDEPDDRASKWSRPTSWPAREGDGVIVEKLCRGERFPLAGRRRQARGGRPPRAGQCHRRRRAHHSRAGRDRETRIRCAATAMPRR